MHTYTYKYARTTYMRVVHKHTHVHMPVNGDTYIIHNMHPNKHLIKIVKS